MKNFLLPIGIIVIIGMVGFLIYQTVLNYQTLIKEKESQPKEDSQPSSQEPGVKEEGLEVFGETGDRIRVPKALEEKSIVMIIAFKDFRDEEYFVPKQIFLAAGAKKVLTASSQMGQALGADGGEAPIQLLVKDINVADFDAVVFIGGPGALKYLDNEDSYRIARETISQNKSLSAICISPAILAKAGVLQGKKATVWTSQMDKSAIKVLEENGAVYQDQPVVADGKIITGNGPQAAEEFGMKIVETLTGE